jgi:hypothetical protein
VSSSLGLPGPLGVEPSGRKLGVADEGHGGSIVDRVDIVDELALVWHRHLVRVGV